MGVCWIIRCSDQSWLSLKKDKHISHGPSLCMSESMQRSRMVEKLSVLDDYANSERDPS